MSTKPTPRTFKVVDVHVHIWEFSRRFEIKAVRQNRYFQNREFGVNELVATLRENGVAAAYLVQTNPELAETRWLLDVATRISRVAGVVGWVNLESPVQPQLEALGNNKKLVAIRAQLPRYCDDYISRKNVQQALKEIAARGIVLSILAHRPHHNHCIKFLSELPDAKVVLNHCGWPILDGCDQSEWRRQIFQYSERKRTFIQISGVANRSIADLTLETLRPVLEHLVDCFGSDRILFGSDWPMHCLRGLCHSSWINLVYRALVDIGLTEAEIELAFSKTADRIYSNRFEATEKNGASNSSYRPMSY